MVSDCHPGLHLAVVEEVVKHLADNAPRLLGMPVIILDVKRLRIILVPNATFPPERRNATLGRHASSCECHNVFRLRQKTSRFFDFFFHVAQNKWFILKWQIYIKCFKNQTKKF